MDSILDSTKDSILSFSINELNHFPPSLIIKKGKWYVQVTIPKELRHLYSGRKQKQISTGTSEKRLAERKVHSITSKIYAEFELKAKQSPWDKLVKELGLKDIVYWPNRYEDGIYVDVDFETTPIDSDEAASAIKMAKRLLTRWQEAREDCNTSYDLENNLLWSDFRKASDYLVDVATQLKLEFPDMELDHPTRPAPLPKPQQQILLSQDQSPFFSTLIEGYLQSKSDKDVSQRKLACERAIKYIGDKPITQYDRLDALDMAKAMAKDDFSNKRIKTLISYIRGLFYYAGTIRGENGKVVLAQQPWTDLKLSEYGSATRSYKPFNKNELYEIFRQEMNAQERLLLSILATTGMRIDEAALMTWERIAEYQGIPCFSLLPSTESENVLVKNSGSKRYIPVPNIIRPNFSDTGSGRLFDYRTHNGKAQAKASDALMPIIRKVTLDNRKVVHSLRGNFKDLIRDAGHSKEMNDFLTGHAQGDVAGRYGQGPSMKKRLEVLNSIQHPYIT